MEVMLAGLVILLVVAAVAVLAMLRAGIRRQERAASLTCQPHGLSAALARRILGLHARKPNDSGCFDAAGRPASLIANGKESRSS
jgi:hypothetical protein